MPFNLRHFEEETKARMGVVECVSHKMIEPFQVLYEKPSKFLKQNDPRYRYSICTDNYTLVVPYAVYPDTMLDEHFNSKFLLKSRSCHPMFEN